MNTVEEIYKKRRVLAIEAFKRGNTVSVSGKTYTNLKDFEEDESTNTYSSTIITSQYIPDKEVRGVPITKSLVPSLKPLVPSFYDSGYVYNKKTSFRKTLLGG